MNNRSCDVFVNVNFWFGFFFIFWFSIINCNNCWIVLLSVRMGILESWWEVVMKEGEDWGYVVVDDGDVVFYDGVCCDYDVVVCCRCFWLVVFFMDLGWGGLYVGLVEVEYVRRFLNWMMLMIVILMVVSFGSYWGMWIGGFILC